MSFCFKTLLYDCNMATVLADFWQVSNKHARNNFVDSLSDWSTSSLHP